MKVELDKEDIEKIASGVIEKLKPLIDKKEIKDAIFTAEEVAGYLKVDLSWVYRQVSNKTIPYFKSGKYVRFKKSAIDKWIETRTIRPISLLQLVKSGG